MKIAFRGEVLYEPPFGLCGLSEDETAIATIMYETGEYACGAGKNPYGFEEALRDAEMGSRIHG